MKNIINKFKWINKELKRKYIIRTTIAFLLTSFLLYIFYNSEFLKSIIIVLIAYFIFEYIIFKWNESKDKYGLSVNSIIKFLLKNWVLIILIMSFLLIFTSLVSSMIAFIKLVIESLNVVYIYMANCVCVMVEWYVFTDREFFYKRVIHWWKIKKLRKEHVKMKKYPNTRYRMIWILIGAIITYFLLRYFGAIDSNLNILSLYETDSFIKLSVLIATAPIIFLVWSFRDKSRLLEIDNQRKDINLKEFQQLQQWATGNTDGNTALQISALHSLRGYLKGNYGVDFRRGAYEIFVSTLQKEHDEILKKVDKKLIYEITKKLYGPRKKLDENIKNLISQNELCKQLNRIASEEWFSLLVNHDFPTATISLVGVDLSDAYMRIGYDKGLDLRGARLQGANLRGADLRGANLSEADLSEANLFGADLSGADLSGANLFLTNLSEADLSEANLSEANLFGADLSGADLSGANLSVANLSEANLSGVNLSGVNLSGADLSGANLFKANLSEANLSEANLSEANLSEANLFLTNLSEADLSEANLSGANLSVANLSEVNLSGVNLSGVNLSGADLSGANLFKANLFKANLSEANLSEANLFLTNLSEANLSEANLSEAKLFRANLSGASLVGANLFGADLSVVNLFKVNLSGANLSGASLVGANLSGADLSEADLRGACLRDVKITDKVNFKETKLHGIYVHKDEISYQDATKRIEYRTDKDAEIEDFKKQQGDKLDLSGAIMGKYSQKDAEEMIYQLIK